LVVRMLGLGYFPYTRSHLFIGNCLMAQNAGSDGGLADMDSLQLISDVTDEWEFHQTFVLTVVELSNTIMRLLRGDFLPARSARHDIEIVNTLMYCRMWEKFKHLILKEQGNGASFDPRIIRLISSEDVFRQMSETLSALYPAI
jgi:hypothetical protein